MAAPQQHSAVTTHCCAGLPHPPTCQSMISHTSSSPPGSHAHRADHPPDMRTTCRGTNAIASIREPWPFRLARSHHSAQLGGCQQLLGDAWGQGIPEQLLAAP
eukprot:7299234-Alexandrium_andersonii.AAC.1